MMKLNFTYLLIQDRKIKIFCVNNMFVNFGIIKKLIFFLKINLG